MNLQFKIYDLNSGHCQLTYATRNKNNERIFYCLQQDTDESVRLLRCTNDGEPSHVVKFKEGVNPVFEVPQGDSKLEELCRQWIKERTTQ